MSNYAILKRLTLKAKSSVCKYKVSAVAFDKKGNVLGYSSNKFRFSKYRGGLHAEMILMARYGKNIKRILILRTSNTGQISVMDACPVCSQKAKELGIRIISLSPGKKHETSH